MTAPIKQPTPLVRSLRSLSKQFSVAVILIGCIVLLGWGFNLPLLKSILPNLPTMKVNTALCFILAGTALRGWHQLTTLERTKVKWQPRLISNCAVLIVLIAGLTLVEYGLHLNLGIDQLLMRQPEPIGSAAIPGRMAPNTACAFLAIGLALLVLIQGRKRVAIAQGFALVAWLISFIGLLGHIYGGIIFYTVGSFTGMAISTAIAFQLISIGILCALPDRGFMPLISSNGAGSLMLRRLIPIGIILMLLDSFTSWGYRLNFYGRETEDALSSTLQILVFVGLVSVNAQSLNRMDRRRRQVEQELQNINAELEQHVNQRTFELQMSQARFAGILELASDAIVSIDADQRITLFNQEAEKIFGYSADEVLGQSLDLLLPTRSTADYYSRIAEFNKPFGNAKRIGEHREIMARRKDGTEFPAEVSLSKLAIGDEIIFTAFIQDVSHRKQVEAALRNSEEQFRRAFEDASVGMAIVSLEGGWVRVNSALCQIVGYSHAELFQLTFQDITHADDLEIDLAYVHQLLAGEISIYQMEKRYLHKQGYIVWVLLNVSLVQDEQGKPLHFISHIHNISDRKRIEE